MIVCSTSRSVAAANGRSGQQLVEHHAEREDVAARVERLARGLLRRHVGDRADDHAGPRVRADHARVSRRRRAGFEQLGQAEVGELGVAVLRDEDVVGLDVAVQDAGGVRGRQAVGDADEQVDDLAPRALLACAPSP